MLRGDPWSALIPVLVAIPIVGSTGSIDDIDAYWHVVLGREILDERTATAVGDGWAWFDPDQPWTTSQWLSEAIMALLVDQWGWASLVVAATLLVAVLALIVVGSVLARAHGRRAVAVITVALVPLVLFVQVRPALVSLLFTVMLAHAADRLLAEGRLPSWWWVPLTVVWANMHGQWVLAPAAFGLALVLRWLEHPPERVTLLRRGLIRVGLVGAAGCLTPLGIDGLLLPFVMRGATSHLDEWQPTLPLTRPFLALALVVGLMVFFWVRAKHVSRPDLLYTAFWLLFALPAERNIVVSALMLVPVLARAAAEPTTPPRSRPEDARAPAVLIGLSAAAAVLLTAASLVRIDALKLTTPMTIAEYLSERYDEVRVLNHYNSAGVLVAFGPPGIQLGIDGRAERYGREYIDRYLDTFALRGQEWQGFLDEFDPQAAVVEEDQAIRHLLMDDWGWRIARRDDPYILLVPPESGHRRTTQDGP